MNAFLGLLLSYLRNQKVEIELPNLTVSLQDYPVRVTFPDLNISTIEILQMQCFLMIRDIRMILENEDLEDRECFQKIEAIMDVYDEYNIPITDRHDFS